jgi:DNA polymerase-1
VHDELVFEVPDGELDLAMKKIPEIMSAAANLTIPLVVSIGSGANWEKAH